MATMKNYFGTLNSADDHLLRDAISANNYVTKPSLVATQVAEF